MLRADSSGNSNRQFADRCTMRKKLRNKPVSATKLLRKNKALTFMNQQFAVPVVQALWQISSNRRG